MPVTSGGAMIAPFADEAMRLLRETWANPTMLAEEVFAILQQKIPQRANTLNVVVSDGTSPAITLRQNGDGPFILMQDRFGNEVAQIGANGRLRAADPARRSVSRVKPTIVWANPADITAGTALSGTQLNAIAVVPDTAIEIDGVFEYSPASGTVLSPGDNQTLSVNFTPTNQAAYKRARGTVSIDVVSSAVSVVQSASASFAGAGPTITFVSNVTLANTIVVACQTENQPSGITHTVTDSQGNSYSQVGSYVEAANNSGDFMEISVWKATVGSTGPNVVSIAYSNGASGYKAAYELSNVGSVESVVTGSGTDASPGASFDLGPLGVTGSGNMVLAVYGSHASIAITGYSSALGGVFLSTKYKLGFNSPTTVSPTNTPVAVWAGMAISIKNA